MQPECKMKIKRNYTLFPTQVHLQNICIRYKFINIRICTANYAKPKRDWRLLIVTVGN